MTQERFRRADLPARHETAARVSASPAGASAVVTPSLRLPRRLLAPRASGEPGEAKCGVTPIKGAPLRQIPPHPGRIAP